MLHEELFGGISLDFREMAEAESCLHPAADDASLWQHLPQQATWLWNGLRLVAPAYDVAAVGLNPDAFIASWVARGADAELIKGAEYLAYELAGFYAFATKPDDAVMAELRQRVRFLVEDAPALAISINPNAPIITRNLAELYAQSSGGQAETLTPLANCGKNLSRTPVVEISFGATKGKLILSQLFTAGRLAPEFIGEGHYGIRNDPAAQQFVLNMLGRLVC